LRSGSTIPFLHQLHQLHQSLHNRPVLITARLIRLLTFPAALSSLPSRRVAIGLHYEVAKDGRDKQPGAEAVDGMDQVLLILHNED
jgi:hypothetical protein